MRAEEVQARIVLSRGRDRGRVLSDDAGLKLLAAIEALSAEIRGIRGEMADDREARGLLNARRAKDRDRKARSRPPRKSVEVSAEIRGTAQVLKEQDLDQLQKKEDLRVPRTIRGQPPPKATGAVWLAYSNGYRTRYGAEPVRNAKVNGQLAQLLKRIPVEAAPEVAGFYLTHRASRYSQVGHSVGMLLFDAEKLHTEWLTGKQITNTESRQQDRTKANVDGWMEHLSPEGRANALAGK